MSFTYFAGDIGGTNARISLYSVPESGDEELLESKIYPSQDFNSLTNVILTFIEEFEITEIPRSACFSVAGPVKDGHVNLTNLGWELSETEMESEIGIGRVVFLNDFAACGYGIKMLRSEELYELTNNKKAVPYAPKIIIGAGTGLGEANIFESPNDFIVVPGEGGHTDFAPRNKVEFDLMAFIKKKLNLSRVGVERVVSGPGLENIYWFFAHQDPKIENTEVSNRLRCSDTPGKIISSLAISRQDVICEKALHLFISCYGAEAGNMALSVLPSGGVYIAGGIAPQIRDVMRDDFLDSFYNKGRMRPLLATFPIYIVTNLSVGTLGARYMARQKIFELEPRIQREMSVADISKMSRTAGLLSEEGVIPVERAERKESSERRNRVERTERERSRAGRTNGGEMGINVAWMAVGMALSGLMLAAFVVGRRSK